MAGVPGGGSGWRVTGTIADAARPRVPAGEPAAPGRDERGSAGAGRERPRAPVSAIGARRPAVRPFARSRHPFPKGFPVRFAVTITALFAALLLAAPGCAAPSPPRVSRVLVVSVDGLRPDVLLRAHAPVLRSLMERGSFTMWAATTDVAITLPSHVSMLTGVTPARHGVAWNGDFPSGVPAYPKRPTLFDLAKRSGLTTAMIAGKSKFAALARPGSLDRWYAPGQGNVADQAVADTAVRWIGAYAPQVLFVHLPDGDRVGHAQGWGSPEHERTVASSDRQLGRVLQALAMRHVLDSTVVIVSADHGGAGRSHGAGDVRSLMIPWIVCGPGIRRGFDLTLVPARSVRTEDTFATACAVLGLALPDSLDGSPVYEAFESDH